MTSTIAIINARRVWRGGPVLHDEYVQPSSYPEEHNAVLIEGGAIAFVGSTEDVMVRFERLRTAAESAPQQPVAVEGGRPRLPTARVIDCHNRGTVLPGLIDSHVHFLDGGRYLRGVWFDNIRSKTDFIDTLRRHIENVYDNDVSSMRAADQQAGSGDSANATPWLIGRGWNETYMGELPSRHWLDSVRPDVPMILASQDEHSLVVNTVVLRMCNLMPPEDVEDESTGVGDNASSNRSPGCNGQSGARPALVTSVEGGRIDRDEDGIPTGVLRDNATKLARSHAVIPESPLVQQRNMNASSDYFLAHGFTTVCSMTSIMGCSTILEIRFMQQMEREGKMRVRVRSAVRAEEINDLMTQVYEPIAQQLPQRSDAFTRPWCFTALSPSLGGGYFFLGAVKIISDGSLCSRSAAMNRPYGYNVCTDGDLSSELDEDAIAVLLKLYEAAAQQIVPQGSAQCQCGLFLLSQLSLRNAIQLAHRNQLQLCVHAIGDRAVATTNRLLAESTSMLRQSCDNSHGGSEEANSSNSNSSVNQVTQFMRDSRSRVEHCQHIANVSKEMSRMAQHNILASMQPSQLLLDSEHLENLLGENRRNKSYLWGTMLRHGIRVILGSDWPVVPADAMDALRAAVTRVPRFIPSMSQHLVTRANPHVSGNRNDSVNALQDNLQASSDASQASAADGQHADNGTQAAACAESNSIISIVRTYHDRRDDEECLSIDTCLRAYTTEAAYGAFLEDHLGTLEVGKYADICIWSDDLLDDSEHVPLYTHPNSVRWWQQGRQPQVLYTIVGGIVEYEHQ